MIIVSAAQTRLLASRSPLAADWPRRCAMHAEGDLAEVPVRGRLQRHVTAPPRLGERLTRAHSRGSLSHGRRSFQQTQLAKCHPPDGDTDTRPQTSTKRTIFQRPSYVPDSRSAKGRPDTFVFPRDPSHPIGIAGRAQRVQLGGAVGVGADNLRPQRRQHADASSAGCRCCRRSTTPSTGCCCREVGDLAVIREDRRGRAVARRTRRGNELIEQVVDVALGLSIATQSHRQSGNLLEPYLSQEREPRNRLRPTLASSMSISERLTAAHRRPPHRQVSHPSRSRRKLPALLRFQQIPLARRSDVTSSESRTGRDPTPPAT